MISNLTGLLKQFLYDPSSPLLFTHMFFWVFFLIVLLGYSLVYKNIPVRNGYLFFVSLYFYYKCSGFLVWLLVFSIVINYFIGLGLSRTSRSWLRKTYVGLAVFFCIALLSYFKYAYFFTGVWDQFFHTHYNVENYLGLWANQLTGTSEFDVWSIILPVGISFYSFQALSYIVDLYRNQTPPVKNIIDFGFFKSFFPQLVAGPIVRASEFVPQMYKQNYISKREMGHALFLILSGLIKKIVISDYISLNYVDRIFESPLSYSGFENLMGVYGYALQIYCDFSGYTDIAIGVALLLGFRIPINFNSPYKAVSLTDFWRRWHISLSSWLRDYLYISMGGNRRGKFRANLNLFVTMLIGGLWHGANIRFIIWGGLHALGLLIHRLWEYIFGKHRFKEGFKKFFFQFITFQFVVFAWIFFRSKSMEIVDHMLYQIAHHFEFMHIPEMVRSYATIFSIMAIGFVLHWIPSSFKEKYRGWFIRTPLIVKAILTILVALLIYQVKSSVLQPFIYFQF